MRKGQRFAAAIAAAAVAAAMFGVSTSPGRQQAARKPDCVPTKERPCIVIHTSRTTLAAVTVRKAGKPQQEYLLAIPGIRGTGGGTGNPGVAQGTCPICGGRA